METITEITGESRNARMNEHNELNGIYLANDGRKLRVVIHIDAYYANPSQARVDLWDGERWNLVSTLLADYVGTAAGLEILHGYRDELLDTAAAVLA